MASVERLLLVEDDAELAQLIVTFLAQYGFHLDIESDGERALHKMQTSSYDLVILDLMLPSLDGISICREYRKTHNGPVLMLTASKEVVDQILGLELGADDFISKPVEPRLLLARVRALLRRAGEPKSVEIEVAPNTKSRCQFDDVVIDYGARMVSIAQLSVTLTGPEFDLLWLLATHAGTILSRDDIFKHLRGIDYDGSNRSIDVAIAHIRSKLSASPAFVQRIRTVRNRGYLLAT